MQVQRIGLQLEFYVLFDDISDMNLTTALQSLMTLFVTTSMNFSAEITELVKNQVNNWIASQARFIQALFGNLS